jgi:hypothetical protein
MQMSVHVFFFFFFFFFFFPDGATALHLAVAGEHEDLVNYLLGVPGINLNIRDKQGQTPLYIAVSSGLKSIALALAEAGADIEGDPDTDPAPAPSGGGGGGHLDDEIDAAFQVIFEMFS